MNETAPHSTLFSTPLSQTPRERGRLERDRDRTRFSSSPSRSASLREDDRSSHNLLLRFAVLRRRRQRLACCCCGGCGLRGRHFELRHRSCCSVREEADWQQRGRKVNVVLRKSLLFVRLLLMVPATRRSLSDITAGELYSALTPSPIILLDYMQHVITYFPGAQCTGHTWTWSFLFE